MKEGSDPGNAKWRESDLQFGRPSNLSQADDLFSMFVKLRLDLKVYDLVNCFELSQSSISQIFSIWINYCYLHLGMLP